MFKLNLQPFLSFLIKKSVQRFNVYGNQLFAPFEIIGQEKIIYDYNVENYDSICQAYLFKKRTHKHEIAPKIYALAPLKKIEGLLKTQKLLKFQKMLNLSELSLYKSKEEIDTKYILSVLCENYFKEMMDEYLSKSLFNGSMPPMCDYPKYLETKQKILKLYRVFFYGDVLGDLENEIELLYLQNKEIKWKKYVKSNRPQYKCLWTEGNSRALANLRNKINLNPNLYECSRIFAKRSNFEEKRKNVNSINQLTTDSWLKKLIISWITSRFLNRSKYRASRSSKGLLKMIINYADSYEFLQALDIPEDFQTKYGILNLHVWLLTNRLREINSGESNFMAKDIEIKFINFLNLNASRIHLRKRNDLVKDLRHIMMIARNNYYLHLYHNPKTKDNVYFKIDALIWSTVFFEKIPRYADEVYLMGEYFLTHFERIKSLSFSQIENFHIEWDINNIRLNYRQEIEKLNPPLSEEEFLKEKEGNHKIKKYFYTYEK